eukprot:CAMPEP_0194743002 /NCGR_PEP_ID=MMETSP0296-20130528/100070_1 /TAXON_ID=39354 /ORGANISM="Heterosigma akashiwo, Strain CCMP2393" /LENGTH=268 /DNA_ID=CAMNT_0039654983 /DNA_START=623 /DNA_END=1429 /DNA_ORIENTATION=-
MGGSREGALVLGGPCGQGQGGVRPQPGLRQAPEAPGAGAQARVEEAAGAGRVVGGGGGVLGQGVVHAGGDHEEVGQARAPEGQRRGVGHRQVHHQGHRPRPRRVPDDLAGHAAAGPEVVLRVAGGPRGEAALLGPQPVEQPPPGERARRGVVPEGVDLPPRRHAQVHCGPFAVKSKPVQTWQWRLQQTLKSYLPLSPSRGPCRATHGEEAGGVAPLPGVAPARGRPHGLVEAQQQPLPLPVHAPVVRPRRGEGHVPIEVQHSFSFPRH